MTQCNNGVAVRPRPPAPGVVALLSGRFRFNAAYRLLIRFQQVADPGGGARTPAWRALAVASAATDVAWAAAMRRRRAPLYGPRVAADALDGAVWSLAPYPESWDWSTLPAVPVAMEVAMEHGRAGFAVPAVHYVTTAFARRLAGKRTYPWSFGWQVIGVVAGLAFARQDQALRRHAIDTELRRREAECDRAALAGQHSVALGTANALDRLRRVGLLLDDRREDSPVRVLCDTWRTSLAERTRETAAYLRDVLLRHEQRRAAVPDLAAHVRFVVPEEVGTIILSPEQADELDVVLDGLALRGEVVVDARPSAGHVPGLELPLTFGATSVNLRADAVPVRRPPEPGSIALALNAVWFGRTAARTAEAVPVPVAGGLVAASLGAAEWARRYLRRHGAAGRGPVLAATIGLGIAHSALGTITMRRPSTEFGRQNFVLYAAMSAPGVLGSYHYDALPRRHRVMLFAGLASIAGVAAVLTRRPIRWGQYAVALTWAVGSLVPGLDIETAFRAAAEPEVAAMRAETAAAARAAYDHGRRSVLDMIAAAAADARCQLRAGCFPPAIVAEVTNALDEVDQWTA